VALPAQYRVNPRWVLPVVLLVLLAALIVGDPGRIDRQKPWLRVVTGIVVAFFTLQPDYVNIANLPLPGWAAIPLALVACFALGAINAVGLTIVGIPSFIMTLAMMQIAAGVCALLVRGQIAYSVPGLIQTLGSQSIGGVPWIVIVAALMLLVAHVVLTYTRFGRYVYMVGGNREAAE